MQAKFGVRPGQVIDVLALMGDSVDNVKGVPGIGEKGARELIAAHGSLDALLAHTADVKKKRQRTALEQHADDARRSRELVTIRTDVPVPFEPDTLRYRGPSPELCFTLFSSLGFRTLVAEYAPTATTIEKDYGVVRSEAELSELLDAVGRAGRVGLGVVAGEPDAMRADLVGIALSAGARPRTLRAARTPDAGSGHRHGAGGAARRAGEAACRRRRSEGGPRPEAGRSRPRAPWRPAGGTRRATRCSPATFSTPPGRTTTSATSPWRRSATRRSRRKTSSAREPRRRAPPTCRWRRWSTSAGERSDLALQVADHLRAQLEHDGLEPLYRDLELPLLPVLADLERAGVRLDSDALAAQSVAMDAQLATLQDEIHALAGEPFNVNSPRQLSTILFEKLQLPSPQAHRQDEGRLHVVDVLEELALVHDLRARCWSGAASRSSRGPTSTRCRSSSIPRPGGCTRRSPRPWRRPDGSAATTPNLQNIPIRTAVGREIRGAFTAPPGSVLILRRLFADRVAGAGAPFRRPEPERRLRAGRGHPRPYRVQGLRGDSGLDPHELRRRAKIINYALLYGKTAFTLSKDIGVAPKAAQTFIDAYFEGFPAVRAYLERTLETARETGVVTTMLDRRRRVPDIASRNGQLRSAAERVAVNMPIQGSAADILKRAMIDVHAALPPDARMILTVHDELLFEAPEPDAREIAELVRTRWSPPSSWRYR